MEMVNTKINGEYELLLPKHRAERKEWSLDHGGWEVKRIKAMLAAIKPTDVVFDIGTEEGDISALIAKYTDAQMVLIEPNDRVWPCVKAIFNSNGLTSHIKHFYPGFFSNLERDKSPVSIFPYQEMWDNLRVEDIISDHGFKQLYENYPTVPQIRLDDFCKEFNIHPDVITMDCEGSEFEIMKGAEETLRKHKPIIFMSVHPEFMYESYRNIGRWKDALGERQHVVHMLRFIDELGYTHRCIEYDYHELHMVFEPK